MPTNCKIEFENNPEKIYYSGQIVRGTVKLTLTDAKIVRGIYMQLFGDGYISFYEKRFESKETYLNLLRLSLLDGNNGKNNLNKKFPKNKKKNYSYCL